VVLRTRFQDTGLSCGEGVARASSFDFEVGESVCKKARPAVRSDSRGDLVTKLLVVAGRPSLTGLTWWIRSAGGQRPSLSLEGPAGTASETFVDLSVPGKAAGVFLVAHTGLSPDVPYRLRAALPSGETAMADSRTLPPPLRPGQPFTIAAGSCYSVFDDRGRLDQFYPPKAFEGPDDPIRLRILMGDQLYMDLEPGTGEPDYFDSDPPDPWSRYGGQWEEDDFAGFLSKSPTLTMADDHEFWNDYPHGNAWLPWASPSAPVAAECEDAFETYQTPLNLDAETIAGSPSPSAVRRLAREAARAFEIRDTPLPIFVLDTRTRRTRYDSPAPRFSDPAWLNRALSWIGTLDRPGVLVVSQPLVEGRTSKIQRFFHIMGDLNLPDYDDDFRALWEALAEAPHSVVVLSGDIHWSRLYRVASRQDPLRENFELISSPLSRIRGADSKEASEQPKKVVWSGGGSAQPSRLLGENGKALYTTLTIRALTPGSGGSFTASATIWAPDPDPNRRAQPLATAENLTLR